VISSCLTDGCHWEAVGVYGRGGSGCSCVSLPSPTIDDDDDGDDDDDDDDITYCQISFNELAANNTDLTCIMDSILS